MAHYSHLSRILVVLENCKSRFYVSCLCLEPLKKKSSLPLITGCLFYSSLPLFGSAGHVHYLGGFAPELLRRFQAGKRGRPCVSTPPTPTAYEISFLMQTSLLEGENLGKQLPLSYGASSPPVCNFSLPPPLRNSSLVVSLCFAIV